MPQADKKAKAQPKVSAREAAVVVLTKAGRPMHYRDISRKALEEGIVRVRGGGRRKPDPDKTMKTIRSFLAGQAKAGEQFVRVDAGVFDLKDRQAKTKARAARARAAKKRAATTTTKKS